jgi:hypothetical protein
MIATVQADAHVSVFGVDPFSLDTVSMNGEYHNNFLSRKTKWIFIGFCGYH